VITRLRADLERDEGLRLKPYTDTVGKLTIGIGRNLDDKGISRDEAFVLLDNDIAECIGDLRGSFPWFDKLTEARQCVLINMRFNLGGKGLRTFKQTLMSIERGDYVGAARNMRISKWAGQVGARAKRLADMMESGI
jgi:lysozyme